MMMRHADNVLCYRRTGTCINKIRGNPYCEFEKQCNLDKKKGLSRIFHFRYGKKLWIFRNYDECKNHWLWDKSAKFRGLAKSIYHIKE